MNQRTLVLVGLTLTAPLFLFTLWLALLCFRFFTPFSESSAWWVENRTEEKIWVTPVAISKEGDVEILPHDANWLSFFSFSLFQEVPVLPGETQKIFVDQIAERDSAPLGLVVKTGTGKPRYLQWTPLRHYSLYDVDSLPEAYPSMLVAFDAPGRSFNFGIPFYVIVILGLMAPFSFACLQRVYRKLQRA